MPVAAIEIPMTDSQLKTVAGASGRVPGELCERIECSKGECGRFWLKSHVIEYQPCSHCGKPMHEGTLGFLYCDPCDNREWLPPYAEWTGTYMGLIYAAER